MKAIIIALGIVLLQACNFSTAAPVSAKDKKGEKKHVKKEKKFMASEVDIVRTWELPAELTEISGLAYLDKDRFACVQDEAGTIYIYNTAAEKIERTIPFGGPGDYEGLAIIGNTAYVVRSDGMLYEMNDIRNANSAVQSYKTPLTAEQNIEGLCYDKAHNRLLLAVKNREPGNKDYKGIYEFNIRTKKMISNPVYKIHLDDEKLGIANGKKKQKPVMPSAIVRHPSGTDLYIIDGTGAALLVMDAQGNLKDHYVLGKDFAKPEGITFSPDGKMYVSNEGKKQAPNIMEVRLTR